MNRTIKFRGYTDKLNKCNHMQIDGWAHGYYMHKDSYGDMPHAIFDINRLVFLPVIPRSVGEFTGLYSVDKKEIYEGDLVKAKRSGKIYEIRFHAGCFWATIGGILQFPAHNLDGKGEIVGSVFQNPELTCLDIKHS